VKKNPHAKDGVLWQKIQAKNFRITFRLLATFLQPGQGLCEAKTRAAKMWVEAGVGMERSGMT
jgi:hypothetical protein